MARPLLVATVTEQRSGSKWVGAMLRDGLGIGCLGEAFAPGNSSLISFERFVAPLGLAELNRMGTAALLDRYFDDISVYSGQVIHFDLMFNQRGWLSFGWSESHEPIYDYLKNRGAVVVSLQRDPRDIFVSQKALPLVGKPHFFDDEHPDLGPSDERTALSVDEFQAFSRRVEWNRDCLRASMGDYQQHFEVDYQAVRTMGALPARLMTMIQLAASVRGMTLDAGGRILGKRSPKASGIDYSSIFSNLNEIGPADPILQPNRKQAA